MSKFLTPPVWYDKNGTLNEMLTGNTQTSNDIAVGSGATASGGSSVAIGQASAILDNEFEGYPGTYANNTSVAIGWGAKAIGGNSVAVGPGYMGNLEKPTSANADTSIAIGSAASASGTSGIAIGFNSAAETGVSIGGSSSDMNSGAKSSGNGIAIGGGASAMASGAIAIGKDANVNTQNTIQLGNNNTEYTLNIGNGTGTLGIGSIKFQKMTINSNKVSLSSQGVYLCCTTKNSVSGIVICFIGDLSGNATVLESSTNLCTYVASDIGTGSQVHQIQASSGVTINYCFKIIKI